MKFISTKIINNQRVEMEIPFDAGLLRSISKEDEAGVYTIGYDANDIIPSPFPLQVSDSIVVLKLTNDTFYLSGILFADTSNGVMQNIEPFLTDGLMECSIQLSSTEREKFLLALVKLLTNN